MERKQEKLLQAVDAVRDIEQELVRIDRDKVKIILISSTKALDKDVLVTV